MRVIDITGPLVPGGWSYGWPLPVSEVKSLATIEIHGWSAHRLSLHTLSGTYIETAAHVFESREFINDVSVDRFVQQAWVARIDKKRLEPISVEEITNALGNIDNLGGRALLISTGWESMWSSNDFVAACPFLTPEAMEWIVDQDVCLLGLDIPCAQDPRHDDGALVRKFFERDRLLLAPLVNLRELCGGPYTLVCLPLKVPNVCGTPCRAILIQD